MGTLFVKLIFKNAIFPEACHNAVEAAAAAVHCVPRIERATTVKTTFMQSQPKYEPPVFAWICLEGLHFMMIRQKYHVMWLNGI